MTVTEIVEAALRAGGHDGLCAQEQECGCIIGDLFPCDCMVGQSCIPGYRVDCASEESPTGATWKIVPEKPE